MTYLGHGTGPIPAKVMIVGEAWGENEERAQQPFVGVSGQELNRMLQEAGILRSDCYVTNLVNARPPNNDLEPWIPTKKKNITSIHVPLRDKMVHPIVKEGYDRLMKEIALVQPNVVVPVGNAALWATTGQWAITKWRGSLLQLNGGGPLVIPTIHPAAVLREWPWRGIVVRDFRRVRQHMHSPVPGKPSWSFTLRPTYTDTVERLMWLHDQLSEGALEWIEFDLETRAGHIACAGLSWSRLEAICIPFMCVENPEGYWGEEEEAQIIFLLWKVLCHPMVKVRGQNLLYDCQYTMRWWHFKPRVVQDTMIAHHTCFSSLRKALDFQASMYCEHYVYWKDDGKNWEPGMGEAQLWEYNCVDCVRTREVGEVLLNTVEKMGLQEVEAFQQSMFHPILYAMLRGCRVDPAVRNRLAEEVQEELSVREAFLQDILGHSINPRSNQQMCKLFYEDLNQQPIMTRAKKGIPGHLTCDDEALQTIKGREPLLSPVVDAIADIRTLGIFLGNFILAGLDYDGRLRCSFNPCGTVTYRLSSSKNAWGGGCNLQTVPSDKSKSLGKAKARGGEFQLPNLRTMIVPDPGFTFFDLDLDRADLQVFAWEIEDETYKEILRRGVDTHLFHVYLLDGKEPPPLDELVEGHPKYPDHRGPRKHKREFSKVFCHAVDYVGSSRTIAAHTGRTVHEVDRARRQYLGAHPKIEPYWRSIEHQISTRRYVENRFGYRWYIFDRLDQALPEAVAWIPQSTVGAVINRIWKRFYDDLLPSENVQVLLQLHDSLAGQFPLHRAGNCLARMRELSRIVVPYSDPLVIPTGIETSPISWGDCGQ